MKSLMCFGISLVFSLACFHAGAQAINPDKSAKALAQNDNIFIDRNIQDNQDEIALSQKGMAHGADSRVKELAEQMVADHSAILYSLQELSAAGTGSRSLNANAQL